MKILITGATGLVGKALTEYCRANDLFVNYLTTSKEKIRSEKNLQGYYWNLRENFMDEKALDEVETIIHLAGSSVAERWTSENKKTILNSRVDTARMLFDSLSRKRKENHPQTVKHYISASGISAYPSSFTEVYHETYPSYDTNFLGQVVEEWEKSTIPFYKGLSIETSSVRTGIVLAKEGGALSKMMKPIMSGVGAPLGSGEQWQSWIHIDDIVGVYYHIIKNGLTGIYNGVGPHPVTNSDLTKAIAQRLNKKLWLPKVPPFALKIILGDMATIVLESQKVSPNKIINEGYTFKYPEIKEALEALLKRK